MSKDPVARKTSPTSKTVETLIHDEARRKNIPTAEYQSVLQREQESPVRVAYERRNRDLDPQLVWRGKDDQDWSDLRRPGSAALYPGKGPPQGPDRRPAPPDPSGRAPGHPAARLLCRLQRHPGGRGQDRLLPARPELVEPDDPRRLPPGDGQPGRARGPARQGPVHLPGPALRHQVQQQLPMV